jgi:uncharacterized protein
MHNMYRIIRFSLLSLLLFAAPIIAQTSVPKLTQWATDLTGTFSQSQIDDLTRHLKQFEDSTSNQIVVLMIPTLDGMDIADYAYQVASQNQVGTKQLNNGILVLIVKNDKKARIEIGAGLEGALPDATASYIVRNEMIPFFKEGDYFGGVSAGVSAIAKATAGEYKIKPEKKSKDKKFNGFSLIIIILFIVFSILPRRRRGIFFGGFGGFGPGGGGFGGSGGGGGGFGGFSGGGGGFGGGGAGGSW